MSTSGNFEILSIIDSVARDRGIKKEEVIEALKMAVQVAGKKKYGHEHNIVAEVRKNGEIDLFRRLDIVENVENYLTQISVVDALEKDPEAKVGGYILEPLPPIDLGRVAALGAKQAMQQRIRDAVCEEEYNNHINMVGEIVNGVVKRVEGGNVFVDIGRAEAMLPRNSLIKGESFRVKDRVKAVIDHVVRATKGAQIFLSRTHSQFVAKLFAQEVPEIYDGVIQIKGVVREPGSRAKIAVYSNDHNIDPVGSCVGVRGARVQAVIAELQGEKIDIVVWSADPATYVVNAISQAEVSKVIINEAKRLIEVVVPESQLSVAIGRRGQNVRLAAELTGWSIDVLTEDAESKKRKQEFETASQNLMNALEVDDVLANLLYTEGFATPEDVAEISLADVKNIEGFDEDLVNELKSRAIHFLKEQSKRNESKIKSFGLDKEFMKLAGMSELIAIKLGESGIKSMGDLADLATDELQEILVDMNIERSVLERMIMDARTKLGY